MLADMCTKSLKSATLLESMSAINMCGSESVPRQNTERAQLTRTRRRAATNTTWANDEDEPADSMDEVTSRMLRVRFGNVAARIIDEGRGNDGSGERSQGTTSGGDRIEARAFNLNLDEALPKAAASVLSQTITSAINNIQVQQQQPGCPPCETSVITIRETSRPTIVASAISGVAATLGTQYLFQRLTQLCGRRRQEGQGELAGHGDRVRRDNRQDTVWVANAEVQAPCMHKNNRSQYLGSRASYNTFGANLRRRDDSVQR
jgi:hypothetical protein